MQHRIFLVPPIAPTAAVPHPRRHWETRHAEVFAATPGLVGYRQNRPVDAEWTRGCAWFCSETWFVDADAERAAYASRYYTDVVAQDETRFLERDEAWSAAVLDDEGPLDLVGHRILWFGEDPPAGPDWQLRALARDVPGPGTGRVMWVAATDDPEGALALTTGAPSRSLVCMPVTTTAPAQEGRP